jgi:hypothetical protein
MWPAFAALRAAAQATKRSRFRLALGALVSEACLVFGACFLLAGNAPAPAQHSLAKPGSDLHSWIRALLIHGATILPEAWHWGPEECQTLFAHLTCLVAPGAPQRLPASTSDIVLSAVDWLTPSRSYPAALCAFLHALRVGLPWALTPVALAHHLLRPSGRPAGRTPGLVRPPLRPGRLRCPNTLFLGAHPGCSVLVAFGPALPAHGPLARVRLLSSGQPSRFLPDYIRLKKKQTRDVMSVFMAAGEWHRRLGPLDAVAATVVEGRMVMPKPRLPLLHSRRPNHARWERNEAAKTALGTKFATWTWQGVVEIVPRAAPSRSSSNPWAPLTK